MACLTPFFIDVFDKISGEKSKVLIPCGKCEGCLKKKQSDWISRLLVEAQLSLSSFFVTLTYDENHLPFPEGVNKKDVQLFIKCFRKRYNKFKYFIVSEYGSISSRPHYHMLLFFRHRIDWILLSRDLEECWKKGQHKIGTVDIASIRYCAKYCLKSRFDSRHFYVNTTFGMYSKRPAIGYDLLSIANQFAERDCFEVVSGDRCVAMPRYYRDKIFDDLQKYEHAKEIQEKYSKRVSTLTAEDRYNKRLDFARRQREL